MNRIITILRKPLTDTVARNVLRYGTGGMNIDATRLATEDSTSRRVTGARSGISLNASGDGSLSKARVNGGHDEGRWPANVVLTEQAASSMPQAPAGGPATRGSGGHIYGSNRTFQKGDGSVISYGDDGSAARFFKMVADHE